MQKKEFSALIIAGSDSGSGAGIQGDLKTFTFHGIYAPTVITALTAQSTMGVKGIYNIPSNFIEKQIKTVVADFKIKYIKIGMLSNSETINIIEFCLKKYLNDIPVVLDPVMFAKGGHSLLDKDAVECLIKKLIPRSYLITPNIPEANIILNCNISTIKDMKENIGSFSKLGIRKILLKGGHLKIKNAKVCDVLQDGNKKYVFNSKHINTKNTHGTGCSLASAITANLCLNNSIYTSVDNARNYVNNAIKNSRIVGSGQNPLNHSYKFFK